TPSPTCAAGTGTATCSWCGPTARATSSGAAGSGGRPRGGRRWGGEGGSGGRGRGRAPARPRARGWAHAARARTAPRCRDPRGPGGRRKVIRGKPLAVRLVVSQVRDAAGALLAQWCLLTDVPAGVTAAAVALWYYWRWRIESFFKLLKGAGQQVEAWQQEGGE